MPQLSGDHGGPAGGLSHAEFAPEISTLIDQIAHDLRSALNGIQSWAYVLDHSLEAPPPPAQRALSGLRTAMQQEVSLIQHLEEAVRLLTDDSPPDWQPADVHAMAEAAVASLQAGAHARQIEVTSEPAPRGEEAGDTVVMAETRWLEPLIRHLLMHCLKQARNNDRLQVLVHPKPDTVRLTITESRSTAERSRERVAVLSDFFHRQKHAGQSGNARHSSALLLSRRLGELLGARFAADHCGNGDSADQHGVCICVDLPRRPRHAPSQPAH